MIAFARHSLAAYKVPRRIEIGVTLPRTAAGKVQRGLLREHYRRLLRLKAAGVHLIARLGRWSGEASGIVAVAPNTYIYPVGDFASRLRHREHHRGLAYRPWNAHLRERSTECRQRV